MFRFTFEGVDALRTAKVFAQFARLDGAECHLDQRDNLTTEVHFAEAPSAAILNVAQGNGGTYIVKCWDCGSTIPGHHTQLCEMAEMDTIRDLPAKPGTQWWTGEVWQ